MKDKSSGELVRRARVFTSELGGDERPIYPADGDVVGDLQVDAGTTFELNSCAS